jgi:branched-subunit amino acid ABC-type transport system permease component
MWAVVPAGIAIGLSQTFISYYITSQYADLITYGLIFLALVVPYAVRLLGHRLHGIALRRRAVAPA